MRKCNAFEELLNNFPNGRYICTYEVDYLGLIKLDSMLRCSSSYKKKAIIIS